MSFKADNRIPELRKLVNQIADKQRNTRTMRAMASQSAPLMLRALKERAPDGTRWTEPSYDYVDFVTGDTKTVSHGRPSIRQHNTTLAKSWSEPEIEEVGDVEGVSKPIGGASFKISSTAPHMVWLLEGAEEHRIPKSGVRPLSFWWFKENEPQFRLFVNHPGMEKSEFVQEALLETREDMSERMRLGQRIIMAPIRKFFN